MVPAYASAGSPPADIVDYFRVYYQMQTANASRDAATRGAIQNVELRWQRSGGVFVKSGAGPR